MFFYESNEIDQQVILKLVLMLIYNCVLRPQTKVPTLLFFRSKFTLMYNECNIFNNLQNKNDQTDRSTKNQKDLFFCLSTAERN